LNLSLAHSNPRQLVANNIFNGCGTDSVTTIPPLSYGNLGRRINVPRLSALFELTRGRILESIHFGAIAVVDSHGRLLYSYGDPQSYAFLRSSAKPFQALPFFERNGHEFYKLDQKEQALICASHEGSDEHVRVAVSIQVKAGVKESDLQCGVHMAGDAAAYKALSSPRGPYPKSTTVLGKTSGMWRMPRCEICRSTTT